MGDREEFEARVKEYQIKQLNLKETKFKISDPFDLVEDWDSYYPHFDKPGIYAIFDAKEKIIRIGKASNYNSIGARLGTYFKNDEEGKCKTISPEILKTKMAPKFIIAVAVNEPFQAPSLEEYLIKEFDPPANLVGKKT